TGPDTAQERTEVAQTGAAIDDVRAGKLDVTAVPAEVRAIRRLGYTVKAADSPSPSPVETRAATSYHTYAEMRQNVDSIVAAYPQIARQFVVGRSYQGRDIVAVKISDNVAVDENEPEVLIIANIHARERLTAEQALDYIGQLTGGYATNSRI